MQARRHARWLRRTLRGDVHAFRRLYAELQPPIERYVGRRVLDDADRDDLVATCFERILDRGGDFDADRGSVRAWAFGIARHAVVDHHRRRGRTAPLDPVVLDARLPDGPQDGPLQAVLRDEQIAELRDAVAELDESQRELLALRFGEELRHAEIATLMGLSEATVRKRLSRLRQQLERRLAPVKGAPDHAY